MSTLAHVPTAAPHGRVGEFETEICLPFRVEYALDLDGEIDELRLVPLGSALPSELQVNFSSLTPHEQRCLRAAIEEHAAQTQKASAREARNDVL